MLSQFRLGAWSNLLSFKETRLRQARRPQAFPHFGKSNWSAQQGFLLLSPAWIAPLRRNACTATAASAPLGPALMIQQLLRRPARPLLEQREPTFALGARHTRDGDGLEAHA
ncbi:hypothetical protein MCBRY_000035 [Methylocystis bryophila]